MDMLEMDILERAHRALLEELRAIRDQVEYWRELAIDALVERDRAYVDISQLVDKLERERQEHAEEVDRLVRSQW